MDIFCRLPNAESESGQSSQRSRGGISPAGEDRFIARQRPLLTTRHQWISSYAQLLEVIGTDSMSFAIVA